MYKMKWLMRWGPRISLVLELVRTAAIVWLVVKILGGGS